MNLDPVLNSLLESARRQKPSDRVPYAFEQRVMARVRDLRPPDRLSLWTVGLWRAALSSVAVAVVLVGANAVVPDASGERTPEEQLEVAVVASADPVVELWDR
ncbi:MAG: hypothetical protein J0M24_02370 [Verrucomicrobia bacterium]|nr:hypothetical protein [Verrucomicrobiota bacterium]